MMALLFILPSLLLLSHSSCRESGRPWTTTRSWGRSSSTTHRSDASPSTDTYPRSSTARKGSCRPWKRLAAGSTCSFWVFIFGSKATCMRCLTGLMENVTDGPARRDVGSIGLPYSFIACMWDWLSQFALLSSDSNCRQLDIQLSLFGL